MKLLKKVLIFCLLYMIGMTMYAEQIPNNEIWYEANEKLCETTGPYEIPGLNINAFGVSMTSHTFSNGKGIVTFSGDVTSIGYYAFAYCSGLTSITIPNSVESIGNSAFRGCHFQKNQFVNNSDCSSTSNWGATLYDERTVDGLCITNNEVKKYVGKGTVVIPNSMISIGDSAFSDCSGLTSITIGNSVTTIGDYAFAGCSFLKKIIIGNSVAVIGRYAFKNCSALTDIIIPNSVTDIGSYAFYQCSGLTSISIGNSVNSIGERAFSYCSNLNELYVPWNKPISIKKSMFDYDASGKILIALYVPQGRTKIYQAASVWQDFYDVLEYDATGVGEVHVSSDVKVRASGNVITVSGAEEDDPVEVYSFSGALMKRDRGNARIILDAEGGYIVKVGNDSFKVRL